MGTEQKNNLGTEKISKLFLTIVIPSIIAMVIMGVQGMVDGLFLGNFVGSNAMASVTIVMPFIQISSGIGMIVGIGGTAFIGRTLGADDTTTAQNIFKTSFITIVISGVIILILGTFFGTNIVQLLGANEVLLNDSSLYIKTVTFFLPMLLMYYLLSFVNRIIGKPELFLIGTISSILVNVCLNYLFIVKMNLGVQGAALATGISYTVSFIINIPPILSKKSIVNVFGGKFNSKILGQVIYNGSSEGVTSVATSVTTLLFNLTFIHYYGEIGVSAFTIIGYIAQISNLLIFGVVDGISPIISFNYGAKSYERVKKVINVSIVTNFLLGVATYLIVFLFGEKLIGMFTGDNLELIEITYNGAKLYISMYFICGLNILASSYYTAIGEALKSIIISASRGLVFIIIGVTVLPRVLGVTGVWLVAPFSDLVTLLVVIIIINKSSKQNKIVI